MLKTVDTSYLILKDRWENRLVAYYDLKGMIDNRASIYSNINKIFGELEGLNFMDVYDKSEEEAIDLFVWLAKSNGFKYRFAPLKSYPLDGGIDEKTLAYILGVEVEANLRRDPLYIVWTKRRIDH